MANPSANQSIEELKKRYEELNHKKITADANLATATDDLESIKKEAREKYGTDDLGQLEQMLEEMNRENERKRAEYQKHLEEVEQKLAQVEKQFSQAQELK